jgi:hypothetical protein
MNGLAIVNPLKKRRTSRRKSSSSRRKVKRNPIANLGGFAKKRRTSRRKSSARAAPSSARRRTHRRRRSSPGGAIGRTFSRVTNSGVSGLLNSAAPAAVGAGAALAIDLAWGYVPIPDSLKTGPLAPVTRIAAAVAIGMLVRAALGKKFGNEAMAGALTVTVFDIAKGYLKNNTNLPLSYYGGRVPALSYNSRGLGYYAPDRGYASDDTIDPEGAAYEYLPYGAFG